MMGTLEPVSYKTAYHEAIQEVLRLRASNERLRSGVQLAIEWFTLSVDEFAAKHHVDDPDEVSDILARCLARQSWPGRTDA